MIIQSSHSTRRIISPLGISRSISLEIYTVWTRIDRAITTALISSIALHQPELSILVYPRRMLSKGGWIDKFINEITCSAQGTLFSCWWPWKTYSLSDNDNVSMHFCKMCGHSVLSVGKGCAAGPLIGNGQRVKTTTSK